MHIKLRKFHINLSSYCHLMTTGAGAVCFLEDSAPERLSVLQPDGPTPMDTLVTQF